MKNGDEIIILDHGRIVERGTNRKLMEQKGFYYSTYEALVLNLIYAVGVKVRMLLMTQDNYLFSGTIRENIRYGRLDAADEEIETAAKAVNAHSFIMQMEHGYDTEILVQQGIESLLRGRISFVTAHRFSTIKNADRIFVINQGKICEAGNHEELMEQKGAHYRLYQAQFRNIA